MKKTNIIITITILTILLNGCTTSKTQEKKDQQKQQTTQSQPTKQNENLAVNYKLTNNKTLKIKKVEGLTIKNTAFSTPNSVTIYFDKNTTDTQNPQHKPLGTITVVPNTEVEKKVKTLKLTPKYKNHLQAFMAFNSSTQCSILQPSDIQETLINSKQVWKGSRQDHCTFGKEYKNNPQDIETNIYGFKTDTHTILLTLTGQIKDLPKNKDNILLNLINAITIT